MSGAASPGQQCITGSFERSTASFSIITSWQSGFFTRFGRIDKTCLNFGTLSSASLKFSGGSGSRKKARNSPTSVSALTLSCPIPIATRSGVPKRLVSTGISKPVGFSNNSAGPFFRKVRSLISVISSTGSIAWPIRLSSPFSSK